LRNKLWFLSQIAALETHSRAAFGVLYVFEREDPSPRLAALACSAEAGAFWNLRHLRRSLRDARVYVQAQNGERMVLVRRDASAETWAKAERFLTK